MKLYLLSQKVNNGYDTYDSCVVCSISPKDAITIHPNGRDKPVLETIELYDSWCGLKDVICEYIGEAKEELKRGVICSSFNAG